MSLGLLLGMIGAAFAGALAHEVAHWIVWRVSGRHPRLDWWKLQVRPRAGPQHTTRADRVAAAAPYVIGMAAVLGGVFAFGVLWVVFGLAMVQIPSRADIATVAGRTEWRISH